MEDCLHTWSTRFSKLSYWKGHKTKILLLPSAAHTSINQLTVQMSVCETEHLLLWEMLSPRKAEDRQRAWKAGNETFVLQLVRTNGDVSCLSRLQLYTYCRAAWPYGHICLTQDVILIIYPFLLTYTFPKKLCCSKCSLWERVSANKLKQSSPERPPELAGVFQGCNQTPRKSFTAFWRYTHATGTFTEPYSTRTMNFTLLWAISQWITKKIFCGSNTVSLSEILSPQTLS